MLKPNGPGYLTNVNCKIKLQAPLPFSSSIAGASSAGNAETPTLYLATLPFRLTICKITQFCTLLPRLGGPDPLDYISMYENPGCPELGVPPHWHYIR